MALQISPPAGETVAEIRKAILEAIPNCEVEVTGSGGHFEIRVVSAAFEGRNTLAKQRMVYAAITHLMTGGSAPVHAVDRLETTLP